MVGRGWLALEAEGGLEALEATWLEFEVGSPDQDSPLLWPSDVHPLAPTEFDWLAACRPAAECSLPITLTLRWDPWSERDGEPAREGSMSLSFSLTVLLEYFDLAEPPPGAELRLANWSP